MAKEWEGASGYCNCLFVTLSRSTVREVTIAEGKVVPNLELLASAVPETADWLREQQFQYGAIRADEVVDILCEMARISRGRLGPKWGVIKANDLVGANGPAIERTFNVSLDRSSGTNVLTVKRI